MTICGTSRGHLGEGVSLREDAHEVGAGGEVGHVQHVSEAGDHLHLVEHGYSPVRIFTLLTDLVQHGPDSLLSVLEAVQLQVRKCINRENKKAPFFRILDKST